VKRFFARLQNRRLRRAAIFLAGMVFLVILSLLLLYGRDGVDYFGQLFDLPPPGNTAQDGPLVVVTRASPVVYETYPLSTTGEKRQIKGFEYDLLKEFANSQGWQLDTIVADAAQVLPILDGGKAHMAAAWLGGKAAQRHELIASVPYIHTQDVLLQREASLPIRNLAGLAGQKVYAMPDSRQIRRLQNILDRQKNFEVVPYTGGDELDLMAELEKGYIGMALLDSAMANVGINHFPQVRTTLMLNVKLPIVWLFGGKEAERIRQLANRFILQAKESGLLQKLQERYFGHVDRLHSQDIERFIGRIDSVLPRFRSIFQRAESISGIDWRLLAALSYQESHWNPLATSYTKVRGIMMLTEQTADQLKVSNRLDPAQAIPAAARYLEWLGSEMKGAQNPDRLWLALAAYNIGPGHMRAARRLAIRLGKDPNSWLQMKKVLPLLAKRKYYSRLSSGQARGGEAVILTENVRVYYDILQRRLPPYVATSLELPAVGQARPKLSSFAYH